MLPVEKIDIIDLVDTHAHIYAEEFDADRPEMIARALDAGVKKILMPAIDSSSHAGMFALEDAYPSVCMAMMGLHPCYVKSNYEEELAIIERQFEKRKFIAVGEIGLDFYWDLTFKEQQYDALRQQLKLAIQYDLPVAIHSRKATDECISVIKEMQDGRLRGVFHCFSGDAVQAQQVTDLGMYLGIGGVVTFKNGGLDKVLADVKLDRVILETDAPYLAPVPHRGKRNEPAYTALVATKIAELLQMEAAEVAEVTTRNARDLFRF